MPLTAGGTLTIVASSDLGALGSRNGSPIAYNWVLPSIAPLLLPWLAILALLALKPNRGWSAWWIWLPLACLAAGCHCLELALRSSDTGLPEGMLGVFLEVPVAWGFGLAALWLLASYLGDCGRFRTFLGSVAVLAAFMVFSFAARVGWGLGVEPIMSLLNPRGCAATASSPWATSAALVRSVWLRDWPAASE